MPMGLVTMGIYYFLLSFLVKLIPKLRLISDAMRVYIGRKVDGWMKLGRNEQREFKF